MPQHSIEKLLDELEEAKRRFDESGRAQTARCLERLSRSRFQDAGSLVRFHETLLFIRAYPPDEAIFRQAEDVLEGFIARVEELRAADVDLTPLDPPEVSGIAGTVVS